MSDGPHRSLKMSRRWRGLAERADNQSFNQEAVDQQLRFALEEVCKELPRPLRSALRHCFGAEDQGSFIAPSVETIEALRLLAAGSPFANVVLDYAEQAAGAGRCGRETLTDIFLCSLEDRTQRGIKQMEEHYRRESTNWRAERLYDRLESSCQGAVIKNLASQLAEASRPARADRPQKLQGLDDGASLP